MIESVVSEIVAEGGQPYEVGGCVRDRILGYPVKDIDFEVFRMAPETLLGILQRHGRVETVGASFGVIKLTTPFGTECDFTLPSRMGSHDDTGRGLDGHIDPLMSIEEAARMRDFTMNAIYRCPRTGYLVDPLRGEADLQQRVLRVTGRRFGEDPLRVFRGFQFASRFDLTADAETLEICRGLITHAKALPLERVWGEWQKWALMGRTPSAGLRFLQATGWLDSFPELASIVGVPQDPHWHPEGDVWVHTLHVCDVAREVADRENLDEVDRLILLLSALCHDLGKATTTEMIDGRWHAYGHCEAGVPLSRAFLERIGCPTKIIEIIEPLVAEHLVHATKSVSHRLVRRLAYRLDRATIRQLAHLIEADLRGRPPLPGHMPETMREMMRIAEAADLTKQKPVPLVLGRHLIELGYAPAPWFGEVLRVCLEAQLDGVFETVDEGVVFLRDIMENRPAE